MKYDFVVDLTDNVPEAPLPEPGQEPKLKTVTSEEESPTSEEAREFVGGYWELVHLKSGGQLVVNEMGRLNGLPLNAAGSRLYGGVIVVDVIHLKGAAKWV